MALSFPPTPQIGDQYQAPNGTTYTWDGLRWNASSSSSGSSGGGSGGGAAIVFSNGVLVTSTATSLNFVGSVVTATNSGTAVSVNINIPATTSTLGVVKIGPTLSVGTDGLLNSKTGNLANWEEGSQYHNWTDGASIFTPVSIKDNVDAVIATKGTGSHRGTTDGNKRGEFATDWQKVLGNFNNIASGNYSIIGGGSLNKASGLHSIVVGGNNNTADSDYSTVLGGHNGNTNGITGATIIAGASPVYTQGGVYMLSAETFDDSVATMTTDGATAISSNQITLKDNSALYVRGIVVAKEYQKYRGEVWSWNFDGVVRRDVGSTTTDFAPSGILPNIMLAPGINTASNWLFTLDIDNQNGNLLVEVRGGAAQHIRWSARIDTVEVHDI
jgi:hypothetical protein